MSSTTNLHVYRLRRTVAPEHDIDTAHTFPPDNAHFDFAVAAAGCDYGCDTSIRKVGEFYGSVFLFEVEAAIENDWFEVCLNQCKIRRRQGREQTICDTRRESRQRASCLGQERVLSPCHLR